MQRAKYAPEFKDEAVKQVIGKAHSVVDVAKLAKEVVQQRVGHSHPPCLRRVLHQ